MLPTTNVFLFVNSIICPRSAVVVVFPFVPVIAASGARLTREAYSTSPMTGIPSSRARSSGAIPIGTPGLMNTRSVFSTSAIASPPSAHVTVSPSI